MDIYAKSLRYLRRKLSNEELTKNEWDIYAHENCLCSALTLIDKKGVDNFEELKEKVLKEKEELFLYNNSLYRDIKKKQKLLDKNVAKNGLSDKKTRELSSQIDKMINEYYATIEEREYPENSEIYETYRTSYYMLKELLITNKKFITVKEWDKLAKRMGLLSSEAIKYISRLEWHLLEIKLTRETNIKCYKRWSSKDNNEFNLQ